jgi:uncharacterized protein YdaL
MTTDRHDPTPQGPRPPELASHSPDHPPHDHATRTSRSTPTQVRSVHRARSKGAAAIIGAVIAALFSLAAPATVSLRAASAQTAPAGTLVLYDSTGQWGFLGEQYATLTANLVSRFGTVTSRPVSQYSAGQLNSFQRVVYVGSTYDEPLSTAFLDDVLAGSRPVLWLNHNIWQLTARSAANGTFFANGHGWDWIGFDSTTIDRVDYEGTTFTRYAANLSGVMQTMVFNPALAEPVGTAHHPDGTSFPWGMRTASKNLTYIGEMPYSYMSENDRYVAFAALLQDLFAPSEPVRRRALVRIEDVGPDADPVALRAIADYLSAEGVPFSVATYSFFRNPLGIENGGVAEQYRLAAAPDVVDALKYMQSKGGTLLFHGWTHQLNSFINPYDGMSGNDFEFWMAHVDPVTDYVIYDGPVANDSVAFATGRMNNATRDFARVGLAKPATVIFPHYAASAANYEAARRQYGRHYGRMLYFSGVLSAGWAAANYARPLIGQFFPYTGIRDVYGLGIVPENLGNVEPEPFNNHPARLPADILATAQRNLALNDAVASFFFHPFLSITYLQEIVTGLKAMGYSFVPNSAV